MRVLFCFLLALAPAAAQELRVYSEFQRPDPSGEIALPDRGAAPVEILSPALARNAWASFWIVCQVPVDETATIYIQQNPEILQPRLYRAWFTKAGEGWVADTLEKVEPPYTIHFTNPLPPPSGVQTAVFLMDLWVPPSAPSDRMRLQADVFLSGRWLTYPMELRIASATVPGVHTGAGPLPPAGARADTALRAVLRGSLCGKPQTGRSSPEFNARRILRRNAQQDAALARSLDMVDAAWCEENSARPAEWWLRVRNKLYRKAP